MSNQTLTLIILALALFLSSIWMLNILFTTIKRGLYSFFRIVKLISIIGGGTAINYQYTLKPLKSMLHNFF